MGRVHEALHRLFHHHRSRLFRLAILVFPLKHGKGVHARKYGSVVNGRVKVTRSLLYSLFYLIHYSQLTTEQKSRSKLDRARRPIFQPRVDLWDFDRSWFSNDALVEYYIRVSQLEEICTLEGRKEGCIEAGFSERYIVNERDYAMRNRKLQTSRWTRCKKSSCPRFLCISSFGKEYSLRVNRWNCAINCSSFLIVYFIADIGLDIACVNLYEIRTSNCLLSIVLKHLSNMIRNETKYLRAKL